ncbi:unannotated protein [freshwater metagenome]|uniref:Unannotated protein n=1 Tax=freshwater metagenome TaxID=449393 RepID=A0A6J6KPG9_9ZZZZ
MGGVNVTNLNTGALAAKPSGAECRKATFVGKARERVVLVHELRELACAKELFNRRNHGAHVDEGLRRNGLNVLGRHTLANHALHSGETSTNLVLNQLTDGTNTTVTEVVDVINIETDVDLLARAGARNRGVTLVKGNQVLDGRDNVVNGENRGVQRQFKTELAVDLVTTNLREVVALGVEVEVVNQQTSRLSSNLLTWTQFAVDVLQGFFLGEDGVLLQGLKHGRETSEVLRDFFAGEAEGLQEDSDRLLALTVDTNTDLVTLVNLKLQPCTAAWDNPHGVDFLVAELVEGGFEIDTRATNQLGHDNTLGAVDDEGSLFGHQGEVAHEHRLGLDFTSLVVHKLSLYVERGGVGLATFLALVNGVLFVLKVGVCERELHGLRRVFNRGNLFEDFLESALRGNNGIAFGLRLGNALLPRRRTNEPLKALGLQGKQIRNLEGVRDFGERETLSDSTVLGRCSRCGTSSSQEKLPPGLDREPQFE